MPVITIRLDDHVHYRLKLRAAGANLSISALIRPLIEDAAYPGGRYVYTSQDELIGIAIQTFAIVAELAGAQAPRALEQGIAQARNMLRERGLLAANIDALAGIDQVGASHREGAR
jgi:predicted transcriptional regulator